MLTVQVRGSEFKFHSVISWVWSWIFVTKVLWRARTGDKHQEVAASLAPGLPVSGEKVDVDRVKHLGSLSGVPVGGAKGHTHGHIHKHTLKYTKHA